MGKTRQIIPTARRDELVIQEVDGETLVYDLKSYKAHCLNRTSALIWKHCDGKRSMDEVSRKIEAELGTLLPQEVIWLAVEQLEKSGLLQEAVPRGSVERRMSRREMARKLGIATAIALPFIASIEAPAAIQAASCAGPEEPCGGTNPPCCPGLICFSNSCVFP
ncbi:MAG: PqqD family protein [Pyrinomonadaceae bacterium]|nr:PqqD family protein [Pyrinomonadaceae bacterium]